MRVSESAKQLGKLGGERTKQKYGPDHYRRIGRLSARRRWGKGRPIGFARDKDGR